MSDVTSNAGGNGNGNGNGSGGDGGRVSQKVPGCPNGADARAATAAQVPAGLSDTQRRAIELLLTGTSPGRVAKECGVDRRTIFRWRSECEPFRAELESARRAIWEASIDRMRMLVARSVEILEEELENEYDRSRVRAASLVLHHSSIRTLMQADMPDREP